MVPIGTYLTCPHHGQHVYHIHTARGASCVRCINERRAARKAAQGGRTAPKEQML